MSTATASRARPKSNLDNLTTSLKEGWRDLVDGVGREIAGDGADHQMIASRLGSQQADDAACGIAAGAGLGPVRIADAHEDVGTSGGRLDDDELIAPDSGAAIGDGGRHGRGQVKRAGALVEHDEVVPAAMHFYEPGAHGSDISGS